VRGRDQLFRMLLGLTDTGAVQIVIEILEPDLHATITTDSLLAEIALDLYRLAAGRGPVAPLPVTVIAAPAIATAIPRDEHQFAKEYRFLELLAEGRFTANGLAWRRRAALTQPLYRHAPEVVVESDIERIYTQSCNAECDILKLHCSSASWTARWA